MGAIKIGGTVVIDSNRNLTNIGTISSGAINASTISSGLITGSTNCVLNSGNVRTQNMLTESWEVTVGPNSTTDRIMQPGHNIVMCRGSYSMGMMYAFDMGSTSVTAQGKEDLSDNEYKRHWGSLYEHHWSAKLGTVNGGKFDDNNGRKIRLTSYYNGNQTFNCTAMRICNQSGFDNYPSW
jgi:hypothetical protein